MIYWALLKYTTTGHVKREEWPSAQARALTIVALGGYVQVLEEGHDEPETTLRIGPDGSLNAERQYQTFKVWEPL